MRSAQAGALTFCGDKPIAALPLYVLELATNERLDEAASLVFCFSS